MKTVMLLRHGKSTWGAPNVPDHKRTLNNRGLKAALLMGNYIRDKDLIPDCIYCSTAIRTRQTLEQINKALDPSPPSKYEEYLYLCPSEDLLDFIRRIPSELNKIMIIAHNPGLMDFTERIVDQSLSFHKFSTCALAVINLNVSSWDMADWQKGELLSFQTPLMVGQQENNNPE